MSKTLYLSDLDGTLFDPNGEVDDFVVQELNTLIAKGVHISIATARTAATVVHMLKDINLQIPVILMNGVCVYDLQKKAYARIEAIPIHSKKFLLETLRGFRLSGFLFAIENNTLFTYYEHLNSPAAIAFMEERVKKYKKKFIKVDSLMECMDSGLIYYSVSGQKETLESLCDILSNDNTIRIEFYRDIYREEDWYLEICSAKASKYHATQFLREQYGFDRVIGFGDNLNDLPLFRACDRSYAVANAKPEVKVQADGVIESNVEYGVVKQIWREVKLHS